VYLLAAFFTNHKSVYIQPRQAVAGVWVRWSVVSVTLCVSVCVCLRCKMKTAWAINTGLSSRHTVYISCSSHHACIDRGVKGHRHVVIRCAYARWWVSASLAHIHSHILLLMKLLSKCYGIRWSRVGWSHYSAQFNISRLDRWSRFYFGIRVPLPSGSPVVNQEGMSCYSLPLHCLLGTRNYILRVKKLRDKSDDTFVCFECSRRELHAVPLMPLPPSHLSLY